MYCFKINNPKKKSVDVDALKIFVESLYSGTTEPKFEKVPFVVIYSDVDANVCISMTGKGKKNLARIEEINTGLTKSMLIPKGILSDITLERPYLFEEDIQDWFVDAGPKKLGGKRWKTLIQQGPYFSPPYEPLGISLVYGGKEYPLTPKEEQIAVFYAKRLISETAGGVVDEWTKDKVFNSNFWTDFKTYLTKEHLSIFKDFSKIGWMDAITKIEGKKEDGLTAEEIREKKTLNEEKKRRYGYAILDGKREKVGNFTVEPASIFYGRGANPNRGRVKREIVPEDVTINIGEADPVPSGHRWGAVVHDHQAAWLAKWKDTITGDIKYVQFSAEGRFKGESDLEKYEKARKLQRHVTTVREKYMVDASSKNIIKKQLGTILWLIDNYGVRVGGEKATDEADTVGATTLRVEHIKLEAPDHVIFDFLGKDSIRFYKVLKAPKIIYQNFVELLKGKKGSEQVFDSISSRSVNIYLKEFDKGFSAKVFRTRLGSYIMYNALKQVKIPKNSTKTQTKVLFNKANIQVAEVLNHTRNVSKKAKEAVKNEEDKLKELLKQKTKEGSTVALEKRIEAAMARIASKTDVMAVAINTSLTNYIDPRMIVAWAKTNKVEISDIYTSALVKKFQWAINTTEPTWDWLNSPLMGNEDLEPGEDADMGLVASDEDSPKPKPKQKTVPQKAIIPQKTVPQRVEVIPQKAVIPQKTVPQKRVIPPKAVPQRVEVIVPMGSVEDYKFLLQICENPKEFSKNFPKISKDAMTWIYHFAKYAIKNSITTHRANELIVKYYNRAYGIR